MNEVKILTLDDRKKFKEMWECDNAAPVKIAAELGISQATVYTELRRGQVYDVAGQEVLDKNFYRRYSAEQPRLCTSRTSSTRGTALLKSKKEDNNMGYTERVPQLGGKFVSRRNLRLLGRRRG